MTRKVFLAIFVSACALFACDPSAQSGRGLVLPEGDIEQGKQAFVALECTQCHTIAGIELPAYTGEMPYTIELGGQIHQVKTYGALVTAIINPDHGLSYKAVAVLSKEQLQQQDSPMPAMNDRMTVQQLNDLVALLHSRYEVLKPAYTGYEYVN